jgi:dienelactone hydrolase
MHWGQGNRGEFLSEAVEMAHRGAIGIMIDAPYWRPDVPSPAKGKEAESERDNYIQMVADLRRAVDVLTSRKDVDGTRIGYVGHSLGATWGALGRGREAD